MAIHVIEGSGPPTSAPPESGMHYVDNANGVHYVSVGTSTVNDWIEVGSGGGGSSTFVGLSDTPADYTASANKELSVNSGADAIVFRDREFTDAIDTPNGYAGEANKVLVVRPDETGLEFQAQGGGSLPPGGDTDDLLQKDSNNPGDASFRALTTNADFAANQSKTDQNETDIAANKSDITALDGRVTTNESDIGQNTTDIATNTSDISTNTGSIGSNTSRISAAESEIVSLDGRLDTAEVNIGTNQSDIADNKSDITDINDSVGAASGIAPLDPGARVPKINLPGDSVYIPSPIEQRQSLVYDSGGIVGDHRVKWRSIWVAGTYETGEMVFDDGWTMVANKQTTDRARVEDLGTPSFPLPDDITWTPITDTPASHTATIYTLTQPIRVDGYRFYRPSGDLQVSYNLYLFDDTNSGNPILLGSQSVPAGPEGWVTVEISPIIFLAGTVLTVEAVAVKTANDTSWNHQWEFKSSSGNPGQGEYHLLSGQTELRVHQDDINDVNRSVDLDLIKSGDELRLVESGNDNRYQEFQVIDSNKSGSVYTIDVVLTDSGQSIRDGRDVTWTATIHGVADPAPAVENAGYWTTNNPVFGGAATAQGARSGTFQPILTPNNNAYGCELRATAVSKSDDWDVVAYSDSIGGGIGTSVQRWTELLDTPNTYVSNAGKIPRVANDEGGLVFTQALEVGKAVYVDTNTGDDSYPGTADRPFKTIKAAADYVATQNPQAGNDWAIRVQPGLYVEQPITLPQNTAVEGQDQFKTNIFPAVDGQPLFTLATFNNLTSLNLDGRIGVVGSASSSQAISIPFAAGSTFQNLLINNFEQGVVVFAGADTDVDTVWQGISMGQLGPVNKQIELQSSTSMRMFNFNAESGGSTSITLNAGTTLTINGGMIVGSSVVATLVDNCRLDMYGVEMNTIDKFARCEGPCQLQYDGGRADGNQTDVFIEIIGNTPEIQISDIRASGYTDIVFINNSRANVWIHDCIFFGAPIAGSTAIKIRGQPNVQVKDTTFFSGSLTDTIGIDSGEVGVDFVFLDCYNCVFFNWNKGIIVNTGQLTCRDCLFEIWAGPYGTNVGIESNGGAGTWLMQCLFLVGIGAIVRGTGAINVEGTRFVFTETNDFQQFEQGQMRLNNAAFNEDKVFAEDWSKVIGTYLSTKPGSRSFRCVDELKVGVPEHGEQSNFGQGAAFTRGMLCYTYNPTTEEYTDRSSDARDPGGTPIEFEGLEPNNAIYISHNLVADGITPLAFSGVWMNVVQESDVGNGEIVSEVWDGNAWREINDMFTQAEAPYNQIPRGDGSNVTEGEQNLRFEDRAEEFWQPHDPVGLGNDTYWYRFRIKGDWFNLGWGFRIKLTALASSVNGVHSNIPLMLDLSLLDASFWTEVKTDGSDIRITDSTGENELAVQIDSFDHGAQTGRIWFLADDVSGAEDIDYYIYYGNADATIPLPTAFNGSARVWAAYLAVYHFNETPDDTTSVVDSAILTSANSGTVEGANLTAGSDGVTGNFFNFSGTNNESVNLGSPSIFISPDFPFMMQANFRTSGGSDKQRILSIANNATGDNDEDYFGIYIEGGTVRGIINGTQGINSGVNVLDGNWHSAHLVVDTGIAGLYVDGALTGTVGGIGAGLNASTYPMRVGERGSLAGAFSFTGDIDEVRIHNLIMFPDRAGTEIINMFFNDLFYSFESPETQAQVTEGPSAKESILQSMQIDQIKCHPTGYTEIGEDGFLQFFGSARPIAPLNITLANFFQTAGSAPVGGGDYFLNVSQGKSGQWFMPAGTRTQITATKIMRTDVDVSCPLRFRVYFSGVSANAGDILFRFIISFSDGTTVYASSSGTAPITTPKSSEGLVISSVEAGRAAQEEFVSAEVIMPDIDTEQTFDRRGDLGWITIERVGDSVLDTYDDAIRVLDVQVLATTWRVGRHTGELADAPPPGFP